MRRGFNPAGVWGPRGRGFSMGLAHDAGVMVHLTGQVAWDADEQIIGHGDVTRQTEACFENIRTVLEEVGGTLEDIVSITTWFLDRGDLAAIQKVRSKYLDFPNPPVSSSIMVAGLGHEDFLVELTPVAVVPFERYVEPV